MKPILFNTDMVRAILDGSKTVTRRLVKPQPTNPRWNVIGWAGWDDGHGYRMKQSCQDGDILYVQEAWAKGADGYAYKADFEDSDGWGWLPSIHMPKEAARIFLRVKAVRVERLQDITEEQTIAEGVSPSGGNFAIDNFEQLWDGTIKPADRGKYGWAADPWVWVIEFEKITKEEAGQ